ncbi:MULTISPECIES: cardiolipin synthase ClsB [unclassified Acidovorax]|jgi:cardiolipin synthase|uniref:cardiolipin synthase ClsB n=1 Tax=unclassified Acidovorax TaxID=2684926 RepID=UPI0004657527|nr:MULTISPECIES: cardiolipin synthase ClsB [unclassified Acidovorax]OYX11512.1 MAG: cardiolipin synthase B [Acidovorax sp. 32-64-7]OZA56381.1 MAG: cardiolipin synthase B [Acidovorax sp. 17-64-282]HQS20900.1 cardiolipin synthase ClsB [Acidovorax defluvii]MBP7438769.1 cardiolipin synthase ClsB [Acidovorax sp.]MBP7959547.1 cardiolipin synthase ClsB [Acidovorax sp.]
MTRVADFAKDHRVHLLQGAQELFPALIEAMDAALSDIQFETYIFDFTGAGAQVAEALIRAAQRGVRTHLVVDGVGTGPLPKAWQQRMKSAGVQVRVYSPLGPLGLLLPHRWRRLHRKLCVVDGLVVFCGGINVLDDLYDPNYGDLDAPRFDFAVQATGSLAAQASRTMELLWWRMQAVRDVRLNRLPQAVRDLRAASATRHASQQDPEARGMRAALVLRDNVRNRSRIEKAYRRAIGAARHDIIIANAYFMPGGKLRRALILAAKRGVRVQLLLQGRYEYFMQYHAARPVYGALLAAGVEIHEYEPSFLHAKVAVIDAHGDKPWATVGSSNLDPLSLLLAREANVVVQDAAFAIDLRQRLVHAMQHAGRRMDPARYAGRPLRQRVLDRVAFGLMRLALWVTGNRY